MQQQLFAGEFHSGVPFVKRVIFLFWKRKRIVLEIAAVGAQKCGKPNFCPKWQGKFIPHGLLKSSITFHTQNFEKMFPQLPSAQPCG
ncbi:MAG: hypothetical protein ACLRSD_09305 [Oscillibacter sp.]